MGSASAWDVPYMRDAKQRTQQDSDLFADLAKVLARHNAIDRFGITLLHKHFVIGTDEVILEVTDATSRRQDLYPIRRSELADTDAVETAWKLGSDGSALVACLCMPIIGDHDGSHVRTD